MRRVMSWFVWMLVGFPGLAPAEPLWQPVQTGLGEVRFVAVGVVPGVSDWVFAASKETLYETQDGGHTWQERFQAPGQAQIRRLAVELGEGERPAVLVATNQGLYGSFDGGMRWTRVLRGTDEQEAHCIHVAFHPGRAGTALLGTRGGLFLSEDGGRGWQEVRVPLIARDVVHFALDPRDADRLYLVSRDGVFIGSLAHGQWRRSRGVIHTEEIAEGGEVDGSATVEASQTVAENGPLHHLSAIAVDPQQPSSLYLATSQGLEFSEDEGRTWTALTRTGLRSPALARLVLQRRSPLVVYAATARGVARYAPPQERWEVITQGLATTRIHDLAATPTHLWAATDQGLYRYQVPPDPLGAGPPPPAHELLNNFAHEPTMGEVRNAAIRYAEVHPDKIRRWRRDANLKALLPTLTFGYDQDDDTFVTSRGSTIDPATDRVISVEDPSSGYDFSVKWDLGELLWNGDNTLIDVRSKLMVQLRNDIVDEVTRTYFERRRLQLALLTNPQSDDQAIMEQELRLQELTALIDGFTGGYFSGQMQVNPAPAGGVNGNRGRD